MACFDPDELADFIRHQCIINDDDNGLCRKIVRPPSRKAKPGGLPLNFRSAADSDTSSGEYSPCYLATADCESTYELLQERLRSRIQENDLLAPDDEGKSVRSSVVDTWPSTPDLEFFQCRNISRTPSPPPPKMSITALLLKETDFVIRSDLAEYAMFAAPDIENGRKLLVFYPFAKPKPENSKCFSLTIYAQCDIRISDLVGLCCYEYVRCRRTNDIESVAQYHLLMAEENGEVDRDLPAVDGHRLLSELGSCWSTIALEKRQSSSCLEMKNVVVYTITGKRYEFPMDSLDIPLRWLRDQALKKRIDDEGQEFMSECSAYREYVLETVQKPDVVLDLSSRGDFNPACCSRSAQRHSPTSKIHDDLISSSLEQQHCSDLSCKTTISSVPSVDAKDLFDNSIAFYEVEAIHRYKPKWNAVLTIRTDGFELAPNQLDTHTIRKRNSFFWHRSLKSLYVTWDYVGGVEITDRLNTKRVVKIIWLTYRTIKHHSEVLQTSELISSTQDSAVSFESDKQTNNHEPSRRKLYNDACWKILQLEADVNDAWSITEKLNAVIDDINSVVRLIYKYSNGGSKKPKKAAAEAFGSNDAAQSKERINPISRTVRRISQLTSEMTSAAPKLSKLFPKHN